MKNAIDNDKSVPTELRREKEKVTHDLELAKKADRILEMSGGRLSERA